MKKAVLIFAFALTSSVFSQSWAGNVYQACLDAKAALATNRAYIAANEVGMTREEIDTANNSNTLALENINLLCSPSTTRTSACDIHLAKLGETLEYIKLHYSDLNATGEYAMLIQNQALAVNGIAALCKSK